MNEILKEIKFDIDRILLQLLIPGLFACLPFFLIFLNGFPNAKIYFEKSDGMTTLCLFILSITVGLILEDIGSVIETKICDRINKKKYCKHEEEWEVKG